MEFEEEQDELWFQDEEEEGNADVCHLPIAAKTQQFQDSGSSGAPLCFKLNGHPVARGGGVQLVLVPQPRGASCGFTHLEILAPPTSYSLDPTPIITGVLGGEAAERVLSDSAKNITQNPFGTSPPLRESNYQPPSRDQETPLSTVTSPSRKTLRLRGQGPVRPPNCSDCGSKYLLIAQLRGFMCTCSPEIARSLKQIRRLSFKRKSKSKISRSSKTPKREHGSPPCSSSKTPPSPSQNPMQPHPQELCSQDQLWPPPPGKLVILVDDFYYGTHHPLRAEPRRASHPEKTHGPYHCLTCDSYLNNNLGLMQHLDQHAATQQDEEESKQHTSCSFCYRTFRSSFRLQCHLQAVHSQCNSKVVCKICELSYFDEADFLKHMKTTHKPGEMPYICQVCGYRSSFYRSVLSHFKEAHADSSSLLCPYCLKVLRSSAPYQVHYARHQRKHVYGCLKCRLHFLSSRERSDHLYLHHKTYVRPPQLNDLPAGTKVTVRTFSDGGSLRDGHKTFPSKVKEEPQETLPPLLSKHHTPLRTREARCVECLLEVPDVRSHLPSLFHCSLCKYQTSCCKAYANHMISNPLSQRSRTKCKTMYKPYPRCVWRLTCKSCCFSTMTGDMMANHLTDHAHNLTDHALNLLDHAHLTCSVSRCSHEDTWSMKQRESKRQINSGQCSEERRGQLLSGGGAFIPIHFFTSGTTSTQLSVKTLTSSLSLSSPAMTIRFLGSQRLPGQTVQKKVTRTSALGSDGRVKGSAAGREVLSVDQLKVVLFALCNGLPQASQRYQTEPALIQSWVLQREQNLDRRTWTWDTEQVAEWVLVQREQQLPVQESSLLSAGGEILAGVQYVSGGLYGWAVDLMLHHYLSLQPCFKSHCSPLPRLVTHKVLRFTTQLHAQMGSYPAGAVGAMDELSVFVDWPQSSGPPTFQLFGKSEKRPFDIILAGLADGTFLKPMLFFTGQRPHLPPGFPDNVCLEARIKGFTDQQRLELWLDKIWRPHVEAGSGFSLLILDQHRGHQEETFQKSLSVSFTIPAFIPVGCSCYLQPLHVCITPVVSEFLQARWTQLLSQGATEGLEPEELALTLACWLSEVASTMDQSPEVLPSSSQKGAELREGPGQMVRALTESLIGERGESWQLNLDEDEGGEEGCEEEEEGRVDVLC